MVNKIAEPVFLNVYGAPELVPGMNSASLCSLAGRYDKPIPPRFLAPIDFLKIPAQLLVGMDDDLTVHVCHYLHDLGPQGVP